MTPKERHIMEHATAWNGPGKRLFRNHFVTEADSEAGLVIMGLVGRGLMKMSRKGSPLSGDMPVFRVTDAGIAALRGEP